ncbi:MAG: TonB-dependent receptor [Prolixibacteraceae bacterium]|nr:TonB-dependent receptor [Prolixibacteraceae bacterium]
MKKKGINLFLLTNRALQLMAIHLLFTICLSLCTSLSANAELTDQGKVLRGTVSGVAGEPIPGVNVVVKGTTTGTITDPNGKYSLSIDGKGTVLVFSFIGYVSQEMVVGANTTMNVVLVEETKKIDEVVVVGYGTQKKSTLTGSVASIKSESILRTPVSNVTNSLTGRMPGVVVAQRSGKPGDNQADIFIRGRATTGDASPLIIVDGAERPSFGDIDPNEIESISVLKDASQTALFGIKGGNGVILITTRSGKEGKPRISYTGNFALQTYANIPETLDAFTSASLLNEANANVGKPAAFTDAELQKFKDHSDPVLYPDFNWYKYLVRKFYPQTQHNVNVSGGTKIAKYFVSVGYLFEDGYFKKFDNPYCGYKSTPSYDRYNFRSNLDLNLSKDLSVSIKLGGRLEKRYSPAAGDFYTNGAWADAQIEYLLSRINNIPAYAFVPYLPDGRFMENPSAGVNLTNPLGWLLTQGYSLKQTSTIESTLGLNYNLDKLLNGLSFRTQYAYDATYRANRLQSGSFLSYNINKTTGVITQGSASLGTSDSPLGAIAASYDGIINYDVQASLNYAREFGKHSVTAMALFQRQSKRLVGAQPAYASQGFVGRATYNYQNRYFAELNGAYNGSENFAAGRRYGFFPAVSAGWTISNEKFMKQAPWISLLKIRGSYGKIGFDKIGGSRFLYLDEYSQNSSLVQFGLPTSIQFGFPSSVSNYSAVIHSRIGNPFITWETSTKRNLGFESSFLNNFISVNLDVFDEQREGILLNRASGLVTYGEAYPMVNFGKVNNRGYEVEVKIKSKPNRNFRYSVTAQLSFARNRIETVDEPLGKPDYQKSAGYRIGQYRGYLTDGFYMSQEDIDNSTPSKLGKAIPGDLKFVDYNNDGFITTDDIVPIGYSNVPEYTGSVEPVISYKKFTFNVMIQGVTNVSSDLQFDQRTLSSNQMFEHMLGRWTPETAETATWPALQPAVGGNFMSYSTNDFLLTDASYVKIRNAQLSYQLPENFVHKIGVSSARVYISGQNLHTWTKMLYIDPENFQRRAPQAATNVYPTSRVYNLGINVEF